MTQLIVSLRSNLSGPKGGLGMDDPRYNQEENDDINYPWRTPLPFVPVSEKLIPAPLDNLINSNDCLSTVYWANIHDSDEKLPGQIVGDHIQTITIERLLATNAININVRGGRSITPANYREMTVEEVEKLASERFIYVPDEYSRIPDAQLRRDKFAKQLGAFDKLLSRGKCSPERQAPQNSRVQGAAANAAGSSVSVQSGEPRTWEMKREQASDPKWGHIFNNTVHINFGALEKPGGPVAAVAAAAWHVVQHEPIDYSKWPAAKIRKNCKERDPPVPMPSKMKAADVVSTIIPLMLERDGMTRGGEVKEGRQVELMGLRS